jgi:mannose-6-phosphate isomerase-like protein (cupin superfamily)
MQIHHLNDHEQFTAGDGTLLREILSPYRADLALRYSLAHAIVKPGQTSRPHSLRTSEVYYVLEGQGLMTIDNESAPVGPGDTVYIPPDAVQFIQNAGDADLVFLCIVDPAWRAEDETVI